MRIAAHTLSWPELALEPAIEHAAELGFEGVEILIDTGYQCAIPPHAPTGALATLRMRLEAAGIPCAHVTPYVRELDDLEDTVRRRSVNAATDSIRVAHALGASGVRMLAGRRDGQQPERRKERFVEALQVLGRTAADVGVNLNIETKGWSFAHDARSMTELLQAIDSPAVGILLDPANTVLNGHDVLADLTEQLPWVRHVHFKDIDRAADGSWLLCPAGTGSVPWHKIIEHLRLAGYVGYLSVEYERRWHPEVVPDAVVGLPHELEYLRNLLAPHEGGTA